jgi:hypothetical protein
VEDGATTARYGGIQTGGRRCRAFCKLVDGRRLASGSPIPCIVKR